MQKTTISLLFCALLLSLAPPSARATTIFSYTGNLRTDANFTACGLGCTLGASSSDAAYAQWGAFSTTFHVSASSSMLATTFSYGGGTNGAGMVIADAGFEPYLSLFDASGNFLSSTFFGTLCPTGAHFSSTLGHCYDVSLAGGILAPGNYQIIISAFENMSYAENLGTGTSSGGFTGLGNIAHGEDLHYAFDVVLNQVPEPTSMITLASGLLALSFRRR